jgi:hypothetical protein
LKVLRDQNFNERQKASNFKCRGRQTHAKYSPFFTAAPLQELGNSLLFQDITFQNLCENFRDIDVFSETFTVRI